MGSQPLKLLLSSIAALVLIFAAGQFLSGTGWPLQVAALMVVAVVIFFVGRGIGVALKADSAGG